MASLPAPKIKSTTPALDAKIVNGVLDGMSQAAIVNQLVGRENRSSAKAKRIRRHYRELMQRPEVQALIAQQAQATLIGGIPGITEALVRKARTGRVDAIKLAFEASNFHNPKVNHEHSGEVRITLDIPRPERVEDEMHVVDADVVE